MAGESPMCWGKAVVVHGADQWPVVLPIATAKDSFPLPCTVTSGSGGTGAVSIDPGKIDGT